MMSQFATGFASLPGNHAPELALLDSHCNDQSSDNELRYCQLLCCLMHDCAHMTGPSIRFWLRYEQTDMITTSPVLSVLDHVVGLAHTVTASWRPRPCAPDENEAAADRKLVSQLRELIGVLAFVQALERPYAAACRVAPRLGERAAELFSLLRAIALWLTSSEVALDMPSSIDADSLLRMLKYQQMAVVAARVPESTMDAAQKLTRAAMLRRQGYFMEAAKLYDDVVAAHAWTPTSYVAAFLSRRALYTQSAPAPAQPAAEPPGLKNLLLVGTVPTHAHCFRPRESDRPASQPTSQPAS